MAITRWLLRSVALAVPFSAGLLPAQGTLGKAEGDVRHAASDVYHVLSSPVRADSRDWKAFAGVMAVTGLSSLADRPIDAWIARKDSAGAFEFMRLLREARPDSRHVEWSDVGAARWLAKFAAGLWVVGLATGSTDLRDAGTGCLSTWLAVANVRGANYLIWSRRRPSDASGNPFRIHAGRGPWVDRSFIGGHFANPVACTTFWSQRFDLGPVEPALYAASASIGFSRMVDRRHWFSDTVLAGVLGYVSGRAIARRYERRVGR